MNSAKARKREEKYEKFLSQEVVTFVLCGYLVGVALTVAWHLKVPNPPLQNVRKWVFFVTIEILVLILCHSRGIRCTVTLTLPILCSSKGRSLVIAFAFVLAATGPITNIIRNVGVLTESMSCGETQLKQALEKMLELMKQPLIAVKEAIITVMRELRRVMRKVEAVLSRIKALVVVVLAGIKNAFAWLGNIVSVCNKEFGTPFDRCMRVADGAIETCREKLGVFGAICHATHLFSMLCYTVKWVDVFCVMVVFFNDAIIGSIMDGVKQFTQEVKNMFDVSITFDHDFTFETIASKNLTAVGAEIVNEINARMSNFFWIFSGLEVISGFLCLTVVLKALYFRMKYVRTPSFNNQYLTREFYKIDEKRQRMHQERALPLTKSESKKYVPLAGCRLTRMEVLTLARSMIFLIISNVQLFCICFADYSLYWVLAMIAYYGHLEGDIEVPPFIRVDVEGTDFVSQIFKGIVRAFEPLGQKYNIDATPCLPKPKVPNVGRYLDIALLCLVAWVFLACQPYGLRLRYLVMQLYYPEVARERAAWLYNKILMKRVSFFKLMRRKARAKFKNDQIVDDFTFLDWLRTKTDGFWLCRSVLGHRKASACIICGTSVHGDDKINCSTLGCKAIYCRSCYAESNNTCCICKQPVEYGDTSDASEEKDSSDEPEAVVCISEDDYCCSK